MRLENYLILFFFTTFVNAQTIKGTITDSISVVPFVTIILKNSKDSVLQFTTSDQKGSYKIIVKSPLDSLFLEVSGLMYESKTIALKSQKIINGDMVLNVRIEPRITDLKEVIIKKPPPVFQKKDTLEYNPTSFKDGTEKVVEDLLKKLPGIKVEENGEIKYKGKTIKKMLLDGDDLFDANYTIGSKNISVDMIEKVQGIDHYEENSLLKGIKDTDDVAINLVLKKGKSDISGNATLGYGLEERYYGTVSGVLVNKKFKGFGVSSFNNIGQNATPYDFSSDFTSLDKSRNANSNSKSIIEEGNFNSLLDNSIHNQNNTFYTSLNSLNKILKKSTIKFNLCVYNDELNRVNESKSRIFSGNETIDINESNTLQKNPKLYDFNFHFSNKEKDSFHWEYLSKINQNTNTFKDNSRNNLLLQDNKVQSERFSFNQNLNTTYKISENKALVSSLLFSKSKNPQSLITSPGTPIDDLNLRIASNQQSEFQKQILSLNSSYFVTKNKFKYVINTSVFNIENSLNSNLYNSENESLGNEFKNNNKYFIRNFNVNPVAVFNSEKLAVKFSLNAVYNKVKFKDQETTYESKDYFLNPKIIFSHKLNNFSNAIFNYSYNQILPDEDKMFTGIIQSNYRSFVSNEISFAYLKTHSYNLTYNYRNFIKLSQFTVSLIHEFRPNNYFLNTKINQNITAANQFFAKIASKDYGINISGEKYFHPLRTTFQFDSSFNLSLDNNIVNESDFRTIEGKNFTLNFTARKGVIKIFVVENKIFYLNSSFSVENEKLNSNFQMLTNQTKIIYKSKQNITSNLVGNFIAPNLKSNINYYFLDYEIEYTPNNKNLTYSLVGKNLTNNKQFITNSITDFSVNSNSHNLIERYVMFKLTFGF